MSNSYESDITIFMKEYKRSKPFLMQKQIDGRRILWDKKLETDLLKDFEVSRVSQKAYVYQTD